MDERHLKIKDKVQKAYNAIKKAEEDLELLRKVCEHPETEECNYQWGGPGHIVPATMCSVCGKVLKTAFDDMGICSDFIST